MGRKHILLVDDDLNLLHSLEFILEAADFRVTAETNGQKALEKAIAARNDKISPIDLLITDIQMPGLSGLQLIDELRRMNLSVPVLVITAYGDSKLRESLMRRGIHYCLDKPFHEEKLIEEVFRILGRNMDLGGNIYRVERERAAGALPPGGEEKES
jgi:DNA-binding response OmpR family regulator